MKPLTDIDALEKRPENVTAPDSSTDAEKITDEMRWEKAEAIPRETLERRGVPPDVSAATRASWNREIAQWPDVFDLWPQGLRDDIGDKPKFLLITGPVGCGKSHGAAWILRRYAAMATQSLSARNPGGEIIWEQTYLGATWVDVPAAMKRVLEGIRSGSETADPKMDHPFTVLDDIGAAQETDYQDQVMSDWIRARYTCRGYTVATTNLEPDDLRRRFPRAASRLMSGPVLKMRGRDARRKKWARR